jgi:outer membrane protein assembly factor BamE
MRRSSLLVSLPFSLPFSLLLLSSCGFVPQIPGVKPYRIDIQQGNYISQDMVAQLKPGMSKEQVRLALGTPLLTDIFHADRWDYVYWREKPGAKREQRKLTVFFEDGKLTRLDGDGVAAGDTLKNAP